jgi:glycosyltransferase involved in cell wall biosynthesis
VRHGVSGLIVPPQQEDALADAMKRMMSLSSVKPAVMGRSGRELTSVHYNIESVVDSWESLYLELLDKVKENDDARLPVAELPYREA